MRMLILGLFGALSLTGCATGAYPIAADDCTNCDQPDSDGWIRLSAEEVGDEATLSVEFSETESQVGQLGWHLTVDYPDAIELNEVHEDLQEMLDNRGYNVIVGNVWCVRWNVAYDNDRHLCEGNDNTPYEAALIADTRLSWSGNPWEVGTWSDPSGQGCSAVACEE